MIPVKAGSFGTATANRYKLAVLAAVTNEIRRVSKPEIVGLVEAAIIEDTSTALDMFFMDDAAAVAGVRPAGIRNGADTQASAGNTVDDVAADLRWLLGQFIAVRARKPVMLIHPLLLASLSLKTAPNTGIAPFAAEIADGKLAGIPLIVSENCATDMVIGLDANSLYAGIDRPEVDLSDSATLILSDDPDADVGSKQQSLLQTNAVAVRFVQPTSWAFARAGTVSVLTGVSW